MAWMKTSFSSYFILLVALLEGNGRRGEEFGVIFLLGRAKRRDAAARRAAAPWNSLLQHLFPPLMKVLLLPLRATPSVSGGDVVLTPAPSKAPVAKSASSMQLPSAPVRFPAAQSTLTSTPVVAGNDVRDNSHPLPDELPTRFVLYTFSHFVCVLVTLWSLIYFVIVETIFPEHAHVQSWTCPLFPCSVCSSLAKKLTQYYQLQSGCNFLLDS